MCVIVRSNVFVNSRAVIFNELRTTIVDHMKGLGCMNITDSTKRNLLCKLEDECQDSVNIISNGL